MAKGYRDFVQFTISDVNEYPDQLARVGLKEGAKTGLSLENPNNGEIFPYKGRKSVSPAVVEQFIDDIIEGRIKPWAGSASQGMSHEEL